MPRKFAYTPCEEGAKMLNRNLILGIITIGVLLIMLAYIAITPSPFK